MLVKSDGKKEEAIINQLIDSDEQLKRQHEIFKAEMEFKQALIDYHNRLLADWKKVKVEHWKQLFDT